MRGAKPSSGLVHLHKSFVELHFAGRSLPQNVSVVACIDGKQLSTVLPGQVYSTSCGADHWLLGLQLVFKAHKEPVITHVDKTGDSELTVAISTQGIQDKYNSDDPVRRAGLQQAMEAAALKFAQTAVRRKEGRLQITGPNINIPKKQLRAQWPAILEKLAPQDVQAHIFVDSPDQYISCAAKIILTKAKAEPVFYLSGLSQLLKSYMGAFVTLELLAANKVVRLNVDTGRNGTAGPSLSTTAATSEQTGDIDSATTPPASQHNTIGMAASAAMQPANRGLVAGTKRTTTGGVPAGYTHGRALSEPGWRQPENTSRRVSEAADGSPHVDSALHAPSCQERAGSFATAEAANAAAGAARAGARGDCCMATTTCAGQLPTSQQMLLWKAAATDPAGTTTFLPVPCAQQQQLPLGVLEGMCSSSAASWFSLAGNSMPAQLPATVNALLLRAQPVVETPVSGAGVLTGTSTAAAAEAAGGSNGTGVLPSPVLAPPGVSVGSEAGLWLLADHAAQLQAVGSSGNMASEAAAAVHRQTSRCSGPTGSVSCSQSMERPPSQGIDSKAAASSGSTLPAGKVAADAADALTACAVLPVVAPAAGAAAGDYPGAASPAVAICTAASDDSIHPAALPQDHGLVAPAGVKQQRGRGAAGGDTLDEQHARQQVKRKRTSSSGAVTAAADNVFDQRASRQISRQFASSVAQEAEPGHQSFAVAQEQWPIRRTSIQRSEQLCPAYHEEGPRQPAPAHDFHDKQLHPEAYYIAGQSAAMGLMEVKQQSSSSLDPAAPAGIPVMSPCSASSAEALMGPAACGHCRYDAAFLSQHGELPGDAGAVAVIHRVNPQTMVTCQSMKSSSSPWQQLSKQQALEAVTAAAGWYSANPGVDAAADWSPAQHCSPRSGTSCGTRHAPAGISSGPGSSSPAVVAATAANAAPVVSMGAMLHPAAAPYTVEGSWLPHEGFTSTTRLPSRYRQQQQGWWQHASGSSQLPYTAQAADNQLGYYERNAAEANQYHRIAHPVVTSASAVPLGSMPPSPQHMLAAQQPVGVGVPAAGDLEWLELPDADNLLLVGKGLVQVMNLLGAGTAARLALTRSLRVMSAQDREWLLSITYPHLQDSCKRRALPEMKMILNEVAGIDCFAAGDEPFQAPAQF